MLLTISALAAAASAPQELLVTYAACVSRSAAAFKTGDLSGDSAETIIRAAQVTCRRERLAFVDAVDAFTRERHSNLGPGSRAKVADLFVRMRESELETEVARQINGRGSN